MYQLGIDWKLLLSQAVNFIVLLAVLTFFLYKPLLKLMRERRNKIELGMKGAEMAEQKIAEAEEVKKEKIASAKNSALSIIRSAEEEAKKQKEQIVGDARSKSDVLLKEAQEVSERRRAEAIQNLLLEAKLLIKDVVAKTVSLKPETIDERLIQEAIKKVKEEKSL